MENISGLYMYDCWPVEPSPEAQSRSNAAALWDLSEQIVDDKTTRDAGFYCSIATHSTQVTWDNSNCDSDCKYCDTPPGEVKVL